MARLRMNVKNNDDRDTTDHDRIVDGTKKRSPEKKTIPSLAKGDELIRTWLAFVAISVTVATCISMEKINCIWTEIDGSRRFFVKRFHRT